MCIRDRLKPRPKPPTEPASMPKKPAKKVGAEGDEMELDEDDLKIIQDTKKQGYCYFKRTLSEKDQSLLDAEQMKLRAVRTPSRTIERLPTINTMGMEQRCRHECIHNSKI